MFLFEPEPTAFDLRWRMFGTPVRVHPMFWLISIILGYDGLIRLGVSYVLAWVGCVFVSILLHEFGHIWMGRLFGSNGYIVLYSFGGLAIGSNRVERPWQRILVLLAGPGIQLLLYGLLRWIASRYQIATHPEEKQSKQLLSATFGMLLEINLYWPILNLLPIWPLDGGQISREVFQLLMSARGVAVSLILSMLVAGVLAIHVFMGTRGKALIPFIPRFGGMWTALFFALFCVDSYRALQEENERRRPWDYDEWT